MNYLKEKHVLAIHKKIQKQYSIDSTILLPGNLQSAIESPQRNLFGYPIFPSIYEKAAVLMHELIKLHPFLDGNKRTGLLAAILFLDRNGRLFRRNTDEEVETSLKTGKCTLGIGDLSDWFKVNSMRAP